MFKGWLRAMRAQLKAAEPQVDSWAVNDPWFEQEHAKRRQSESGY